jgi:hypothetical protein
VLHPGVLAKQGNLNRWVLIGPFSWACGRSDNCSENQCERLLHSVHIDAAHPVVLAPRLRLEDRSKRVPEQLSGRDRIGWPGQRER